MIPISLTLSGFLSYRSEVTLDFTHFDLACIAGANGAGKSSLLDAITWVLFGQARKRDESLINLHPDTKAASVIFEFEYEGNRYRIERSNPRGKTSVLEFHIKTPDGTWKPLTERVTRSTQSRIEETLRMDYDTFTNAAFFLQGNADQFTQQRPGDRKRILSNILGLEIWEVYRKQTVEQRKKVEKEVTTIDGRLLDIRTELAEEQERKERLARIETELEHFTQARTAQEKQLENLRKIAATLAEQQRWIQTLKDQLDQAARQISALENRLEARLDESKGYTEILTQAEAIQAAHQEWQAARDQLNIWEQTAIRFHEQEKQRHEPQTQIKTEQIKLQSERDVLLDQKNKLTKTLESLPDLETRLTNTRQELQAAEAQLAQLEDLNQAHQEAMQQAANARGENPQLRDAMNELDARIKQLQETDGAACPLCGQPLSPPDRLNLIDKLTTEGKSMGDKFRANRQLLQDSETRINTLKEQIANLKNVENNHRSLIRTADQLTTHIENIQQQAAEWEADGAVRLNAVIQTLESEAYAQDARDLLAAINAELKEIGYDAAAHDQIRQAEQAGRETENQLRALEKAQATLEPLKREMKDLEKQIKDQKKVYADQEKTYTEAASSFQETQESTPNLREAEAALLKTQEQENMTRIQLGAARQKVLILDDLKNRQAVLNRDREQLMQHVSDYQQIERAFGKDGVPALLIEQALPQIETKANEILDRLSNGSMSVRFITQREYKDKRRDDRMETLDIQISDAVGVRDYEMYSGGEAFRVNFAIRLALSEVLAQRAGARLQTLVIDEGFGSQDAVGRQRLVEAINMVRDDFAKILVITHIDELKDAFPNRIEVEKSPQGSTIRVI